MDLHDVASNLWQVGGWLPLFLIVFYFVPVTKFLLYPFLAGGKYLNKLTKIFGIWEETLSVPRYLIALPYLAGGIVWQIYLGISEGAPKHYAFAAGGGAFVALTFLNSMMKRSDCLNLMDFVITRPSIHPQEFFDHLLCSYGIIRHRLPKSPYRTIDLVDMNFSKSGKGSKVSLFSKINGAWSTIKLARIALLVDKKLGRDVMRRVAPALSCVWASRIMQQIGGSLKIDGLDNASKKTMPTMFLFTHKSFLDFIAAPIASIAVSLSLGKNSNSPIPLFLMAKNHFRKNIFLYRILGLGKAAEALGMIFVDRSENGDIARAKEVTTKASRLITEEGMSLAIFPQGTRALPHPSFGEMKFDSGYYTSGSKNRIKADGKHLKKGAAFIASRAIIDLPEGSELQILPVAIFGTALACHKGSTQIKMGAEIRLSIGEPIILTRDDARRSMNKDGSANDEKLAEYALELHGRIDTKLKTVSKIHAELEQRFFTDIRDMFEPFALDEISVAMKQWRGEDFLVHALLDCIYSCKPKHWRPFLGELSHLMMNFAERKEFLALKSKIVDAI